MRENAKKGEWRSAGAADRPTEESSFADSKERSKTMIEKDSRGTRMKAGETSESSDGDDSERARIGLGFWLLWVFATIVGVVVGMAIFFAGIGAFPGVEAFLDIESDAGFGAALGAIFGTAFGIGQWLVLRRHVGHIGAWVPLTTLTWSALWALNIAGVLGEGEGLAGKIVEGLGHGLILGAFVGAAQWISLRKAVNGARWWIVINGICWSVSAAAGDASRVLLGDTGGADLLVAFVLACGLMGAGMVWLLRRSAESQRTATK